MWFYYLQKKHIYSDEESLFIPCQILCRKLKKRYLYHLYNILPQQDWLEVTKRRNERRKIKFDNITYPLCTFNNLATIRNTVALKALPICNLPQRYRVQTKGSG